MLNETPKPDPKKTKSAPKFSDAGKLLAVILAAVGIAAYLIFSIGSETSSTYELQLLQGTYTLEAATTPGQQEQGLGGRASLPAHHGMLFVFSEAGEQCFWMKDMRFPLDIIWVDSSYRVTHIEHGLSPVTYPKEYCAAGKYVIEVNSGDAVKNRIQVGTPLPLSKTVHVAL